VVVIFVKMLKENRAFRSVYILPARRHHATHMQAYRSVVGKLQQCPINPIMLRSPISFVVSAPLAETVATRSQLLLFRECCSRWLAIPAL